MKDSPKEVIGMEMALWFFILSFCLWLAPESHPGYDHGKQLSDLEAVTTACSQ